MKIKKNKLSVISLAYIFLLGACMHNANEPSTTYDLNSLQGLWKPSSAILSGQAFPDVVLEGMSLEIVNSEYAVLAAGMTDKGRLELDEQSEPKRMRIIGTSGPNTNKELTAIYKFEDGDLVICYDLTGEAFPDQFESVSGTQNYLVRYFSSK